MRVFAVVAGLPSCLQQLRGLIDEGTVSVCGLAYSGEREEGELLRSEIGLSSESCGYLGAMPELATPLSWWGAVAGVLQLNGPGVDACLYTDQASGALRIRLLDSGDSDHPTVEACRVTAACLRGLPWQEVPPCAAKFGVLFHAYLSEMHGFVNGLVIDPNPSGKWRTDPPHFRNAAIISSKHERLRAAARALSAHLGIAVPVVGDGLVQALTRADTGRMSPGEVLMARLPVWSALLYARGLSQQRFGLLADALWSMWRSFEVILYYCAVREGLLDVDHDWRMRWSRSAGTTMSPAEIRPADLIQELCPNTAEYDLFRRRRNDLFLGHGFAGVTVDVVERSRKLASAFAQSECRDLPFMSYVRSLDENSACVDSLYAFWRGAVKAW